MTAEFSAHPSMATFSNSETTANNKPSREITTKKPTTLFETTTKNSSLQERAGGISGIAGITTTALTTNVPTVCIPPCCQMTTAAAMAAAAASAAKSTATTAGDSSKKYLKFNPTKNDLRLLGPSPLRQLLPIALCILSFATVLSVLIVYMDTTEIRHQQFRLNMSRDTELIGISQDNPALIAFLREIHMKKHPMKFLENAPVSEHLNFTEQHELTPLMAHYIADLVGDRMNGAFIQSLTGSTSYALTAPWLAETLNWGGLIVEPEPRKFFSLRKQNVHRHKIQIVQACISPSGFPKEVTLHNEDSEVRINSLLDEENSWFNSRVKCFPLYTLMLAHNRLNYELLSLGCPGKELQILQTLPFEKVNIQVISIHLTETNEDTTEYIQSITKFLMGKSYKFQKRFERNYIYKRIGNKSNRKLSHSQQMQQETAATMPKNS